MTATSRHLHLVDIENLLGADHVTASVGRIDSDLRAWLSHVGWRMGDPVVVACHPGLGLRVGLAAPGFQLLVRRGADGADLALLDWASMDHIAERFGRVVIGSGARAFALFAHSLRQRGVSVHVCTRTGSMSRALRRAVESPHAAPVGPSPARAA